MFVLCPHCQFLVAVDPRTGAPPAVCPKCGGAMGEAVEESVLPVEDAPPAVVPDPVAAPEPVPAPAVPDVGPVGPVAGSATTASPATDSETFSADAMIAAMSSKPGRARAKARVAEVEAPKPRRSARKATSDAPAAEATPTSATTPPVRKAQGLGLVEWMRGALGGLKAKPAAPKPVEAPPAPPMPAEIAPPRTRTKASVKPIPSLRARAKARADADLAAAAASGAAPDVVEAQAPVALAPIEVAPVETPNLELVPMELAPVETEREEAASIDDAIADVAQFTEAAPAPTPADVVPVALRDVAPRDETPVKPARAPSKPAPATPPPRARATTSAPSFLRNETRAAHAAIPASWPRIVLLAALALLLVLQLLLAQRDVLARDARWRPDRRRCAARCVAPCRRGAILKRSPCSARDVRPHPTAPGTLQIDASFRNDARWPQAWPRLVVTPVGRRRPRARARAFTAREYLGAPPTQNTLAPGQTAAISLSVVEPAPGVVSFGFEFR
jgi:hypothetical protein